MASKDVLISSLKSAFLVYAICLLSVKLTNLDFRTDAFLYTPLAEAKEDEGLNGHIARLFGFMANWDGNRFLNIAKYGYKTAESYAFFPLYPFLTRWLSKMLFFASDRLNEANQLLLSGLLISNAAFVFACVRFYRLTLELFSDESFAMKATTILMFGFSRVFMSAMYCESLYLAVTVVALSYFLKKSGKHNENLSFFFFFISTFIRSNGLLFAGFFLHRFLLRLGCFFVNLRTKQKSKKTDFCRLTARLIKLLCFSVAIAAPYYVYNYIAIRHHCASNHYSIRYFCDPELSFSEQLNFYRRIQSFYWDVRLFGAYSLKNAAAFLLAAPSILFSALMVKWYIAHDFLRFATAGIFSRPNKTRRFSASDKEKDNDDKANAKALLSGRLMSADMLVLHYHLAILLAISLLLLNIQTTTRLLSTHPLVYWYAALVVKERPGGWLAKGLNVWCVGYFVVGCVMFSLNLPWT